MLEVQALDLRIELGCRHPLGETQRAETLALIGNVAQRVEDRLAVTEHDDVRRGRIVAA